MCAGLPSAPEASQAQREHGGGRYGGDEVGGAEDGGADVEALGDVVGTGGSTGAAVTGGMATGGEAGPRT